MTFNHTINESASGVLCESHTSGRRLERAMAALKHTGECTKSRWLARLCYMKFTEAAAREKLDASGYLVRFDRTDPRSRVF